MGHRQHREKETSGDDGKRKFKWVFELISTRNSNNAGNHNAIHHQRVVCGPPLYAPRQRAPVHSFSAQLLKRIPHSHTPKAQQMAAWLRHNLQAGQPFRYGTPLYETEEPELEYRNRKVHHGPRPLCAVYLYRHRDRVLWRFQVFLRPALVLL